MELIIICAILGCIPAAIASSKGRSFFAWWIYGALLFIFALIHSLCIKKDHKAIEREQISEGFVKCPFCAEMIKPEAIKCKHCGSDVKAVLSAEFKPGDMSSEEFLSKDGGEIVLNTKAISYLVSELKSANPKLHPISIQDKYQNQINEIRDSLPVKVRDEFMRLYRSKF